MATSLAGLPIADRRLKPGRHVVVAYGRTATTGTAVAWTFRAV